MNQMFKKKRTRFNEGINRLPNATNCNVLPSKLRPVKPFEKLPKVRLFLNSKTIHRN